MTSPALHGLMVCRNEAHRWLEACLAWHRPLLDTLTVFDDRSTDATVEVASRFADTVIVRPDGVPSFLEHEGRFRQGAWDHWVESTAVTEGDWVFLLDADEFWVSDQPAVPPALSLRSSTQWAAKAGRVGATVPVPEVWALHPTRVRTDGGWAYGNDRGSLRFVEFHPGATFRDRAMGSGSAPTYATDGSYPPPNTPVFGKLLHYGYAHPDDVQAKWDRYSTMDHGHNPRHIASIVQRPHLEPWRGPVPEVWRGIKHDLMEGE